MILSLACRRSVKTAKKRSPKSISFVCFTFVWHRCSVLAPRVSFTVYFWRVCAHWARGIEKIVFDSRSSYCSNGSRSKLEFARVDHIERSSVATHFVSGKIWKNTWISSWRCECELRRCSSLSSAPLLSYAEHELLLDEISIDIRIFSGGERKTRTSRCQSLFRQRTVSRKVTQFVLPVNVNYIVAATRNTFPEFRCPGNNSIE